MSLDFTFAPATREQLLLRILLCGESGHGKTYTALALLRHLGVPAERIAYVDSETQQRRDGRVIGSAEKYAPSAAEPEGERCDCHRCQGHGLTFGAFGQLKLPPGHRGPDDFRRAIRAAEAAGFEALVVDSFSHEWDACKHLVDLAKPRFRGNQWAAWSEVTPLHDACLQALLDFPGHVICCVRGKEKTEQHGKQIVSRGLLPLQREGIEFEFDVWLNMHQKVAHVAKTRAKRLDGRSFERPGQELADELLAWCAGGTAKADRERAKAERPPPPPPGDSQQAPPPQLHPEARQRLEALREQATCLGEAGAKLVTWAEGALRDQLAPAALLVAAERKLEALLAANNPTAGEGAPGTDQPAPAVDPPAETEAEREDRLEREGRELEAQAEPEAEKDYLLRDSATRNDVQKVELAARKLGTPEGAALAGRAREAMRGSGILLSTLKELEARLVELQAEAGLTLLSSEFVGPTSSEHHDRTPNMADELFDDLVANDAWAYPDETSAGGH